jgi:O-antigen/teichoic acid export membrane protein
MPSKDSPLISKPGIQRMLGGSAFLFLCRIGGAAATFLTQLLLARWMGAAELGIYILAFSWLTLLAAIPVSGYTAAAVRFIGQGLANQEHGFARGYIRHATKINLLSTTGIALLAITSVILFPGFPAELQLLYLVTFAGIPFFSIMSINNGIALAMSRFALSYLPANILRPMLFLLLVWAIWLQDFSLTADLAMELQIVVVIILAGFTSVLRWRSMRLRLSPASLIKDTKTWNRAAMPLLGVSLFTSFFPQITVIVSGFFLASADIAIYNVGYRVAMLISFPLVAIDAFTAPALSRHFHSNDRSELIREIQHSTALRFGIALTAVIFLVFFGDWVLSLFGPEFKEGYKITILLALAQLAHAAVGPVTRLLAISGHQKQSMYASGAALILWLALTAILMPLYGIMGVAVAVFVTLTVWAAILRQMVVWYMSISIRIAVRDLEKSPQAAN